MFLIEFVCADALDRIWSVLIYLTSDRETVDDKEVSVMDLTHTFVPPSGRGKGIAKILCDEAFAFAQQNNVAIRPSCTYLSQTYLVKYDPGNVQIV